jgi:hypothetical protein
MPSGVAVGMSGSSFGSAYALHLRATGDSSSYIPNIDILASTPSSTSGTNLAQIALISSGSEGSISLVANQNGTDSSGEINLFGIPDFRGATSGSAGSIVGYLNVLVGGTARRLAVYAT